MQKEGEAAVTREDIFHIQVCVPATMTDKGVSNWLNETHPCGTSTGWTIELGSPESPKRVQCEKFPSHVHIIFNA